MINALKILGTNAGIIQTDQRTAMHAAVLEGRYRSVGVTGNYHRHAAEYGRPPVARIGNLAFKAKEIPYWSLEDPLLLGL